MKLYSYITLIIGMVLVASCVYARPADIPLEMLELTRVEFMGTGSIELPKNWRYQPPKAYNDGTNLKLSDYIGQGVGSSAWFHAELQSSSGENIAAITFEGRDITYYGTDLYWVYPDRPINQYEAKRIGQSWLRNKHFYAKYDGVCPETEDSMYKCWSNGLVYIVHEHCSADENNEKWREYDISLYNGDYSDQISARYKLEYEEIFKPLLQRVISSLKIDSYPPKIIEGALSPDHESATLRLANYFKEHVSITLPANWSFSEGNPTALMQGDIEAISAKVAEEKAGASQRPRTLADFLPAGQGRIDMGKADGNICAQLLAEDGTVLGEANLAFADLFTMYSDTNTPPQTEADLNSSARAREKFDRGRAEGLEGCVVSNWQERGHLPFAEALLHDSYLKTCEEGIFEVHSVKFRGKDRAPTFVFTGLFPADKAREMRPVMEGIMNSIRPEY